MDLSRFMHVDGEKPLERIVDDGGMTAIFRTIAFVGDSLSSGEFESLDNDNNRGYHDMFEYSWGQYIARAAGLKAYNFSRGGMTAIEYMQSFAEENGFWDKDKLAQAYVIALGVNDILNMGMEIGSMADVDLNDWHNNKPTFCGYYCQIIQRYREMQPKARIFLVSMLRGGWSRDGLVNAHLACLNEIAKAFEFCYVINLADYGPIQDENYAKNFYMSGHLNAQGYILTAKMISSYIDYIIRNNPADFVQVPYIGTDIYNKDYKY